jgi:hypothetical protein
MTRISRLVLAVALLAITTACAHPSIRQIQNNPVRYHNRTVRIDGTITNSWGLPLVPFKFYKVDDGTGEITVLSNALRTPTRGARVHVKGKVDDVAVLGGQAVGLHLKEEKLSVRR